MRVSIDTTLATNTVNSLNSSCTAVEEAASKVETAFQTLIDLQLVSISISKLKEQAKSIVDLERKIIDSVSTHITEVTDNEQELKTSYESRNPVSSGGYNNAPSTPSTTTEQSNGFSKSDFKVDEVQNGKKIDTSSFKKVMDTFDADKNTKLLELIKVNKEKDVDLGSLLFDESKSKVLFTILKKVFKDAFTFDDLSLEDINKVQKVLLDELFNSKGGTDALKDKFIFMFRDYFQMVCKENKITIGDLIFDKKNEEIFKDSLKKLYEGKTNNSSDTEKFKSYANSVAKTKNVTIEELLNDKTNLLL